ncbi:hypothetical protein, variant 1 [Aphanomyces invadans]|uniref:BZIP domain-containing protein n=1 Tax=Aphanomyces invadans TaxID=157072 RepID=A0A024UMM0_9STRA|nr:hypothetical protein, variant 1 [Aphanomyces invadans]ETW07107.1 hypothetical protein, variant 1 [Aphanomyces invadans]|eukprot:XP_008863200.1 hypothetical protein, variant 1 [Aphanomyces invadans]
MDAAAFQQQMHEQQRRRQVATATSQLCGGTFSPPNMAMFAQTTPSIPVQHQPPHIQFHHPLHIQPPPQIMYSDDSFPASHMPMVVAPDGSQGYFAQPPSAQAAYESSEPNAAPSKRLTSRWKSASSTQPHYPKSKFPAHPSADSANMTADTFADGTQGLVLDKAVLSKLLARDESEISDDQIRSIMQNKELLTIYKKLQEEEAKRQKRLDNNRKTAQLRRKKKKGLVETYESQVSELENILAKIHAHRFGQGDVQTLVDALGGDQRQSVNMTKDTKHQQTSVLLKQHSRNASAIRHANDESWMLALAAANDPTFAHLKQELGLTEAQCARLAQMQTLIHNESTRLAIVEKCFAALHVHEWLHFPNTENLVDLFRAPLSDAQLQKFVQWTRVNQGVIQHLQFAAAPTVGGGNEKDLVFEFPTEL